MSATHILLKNANQVLTLTGDNSVPRTGEGMRDLGIIQNGDVWISHGRISAVGADDGATHDAELIIDCTGKVVMPGFIDPHTHPVFAGSRENELGMKLKGHSYMEIQQAGGGIFSSVRKTREATNDVLIAQAMKRLDTMLLHGTTTVEAKSGYGLNTETELRMLEVMKTLGEQHPMGIVSTFMGAHAIPTEFHGKREEFLNSMIGLLPTIAERKLAEFCDVFCETGAFTLAEAETMLAAAKANGLGLKIHADEIENIGGSSLAAKMMAVSAEHLVKTSEMDMRHMAESGVIGVLLPGTPYSLMMKEYANARKMIELDMPLALATDLNPNCWTESMQLIISMACYQMKMMPSEAIVASTINAAHAVNRHRKVGSIEVGKQADVIILDVPNYEHIPYHFGVNLVDTVIKAGEIAVGGP
ncbi:MAG: imidazolonepropionase [Candidatus Thermoplasmatota archaeon]|nr:imidazolonepropionase [Euryarchaeota archaeon]MBU4031906.1 imidazolonepropionase [Candidatus Thermoplasmatota archaeon]MBU4072182.1 imidazolonepropionase [Candidatus Thermoplasmatota archaeon]MBU4145016.1 imidazolonepropionase [Candidatus Thermoplasmatota archaeon]MBU4592030.1 imidazolonepropionase [Candidatus Thermoplasmatota archaeon]